MFGLLSTFFLVGLCCSSVINNTLDHKQADNEISYTEKNPYYLYDYNGNNFYFSLGDIMTDSFLKGYIDTIISDYGCNSIMSYSGINAPAGDTFGYNVYDTSTGTVGVNVTHLPELYVYNLNDYTNSYHQCTSIRLVKNIMSHVYDTDNDITLYNFRYFLTFNFSDYVSLRLDYRLYYGLYIDSIEKYPGYDGSMSYVTLINTTTVDTVYTLCEYRLNDGVIINNSYLLYSNNYQSGYSAGYTSGYNSGSTSGYRNGYSDGEEAGFQNGYASGINDSLNQSAVATSIFNGIFTVAMLPVNVFLGFMNFEVFGINISGLVSGLITIAFVFIILRFIFGKGGKND